MAQKQTLVRMERVGVEHEGRGGEERVGGRSKVKWTNGLYA